mmetsp:Transcript_8588/g.15395  ORF Transcript_8588/g.15395 Transcript_8588/m.15395 type:complete len:117 (-) Transcript_8588:274-624(-)
MAWQRLTVARLPWLTTRLRHTPVWHQQRSVLASASVEATPCCQLFGLPEGSSATELRSAYRKLARKLHPDRGGSKAEFQELQRCYQELLAASPQSKADQPEWLVQMKKDFANFSCC